MFYLTVDYDISFVETNLKIFGKELVKTTLVMMIYGVWDGRKLLIY